MGADDEFEEGGKRGEGEDNEDREKDNEEREKDNKVRKKDNVLDLEGFCVSV